MTSEIPFSPACSRRAFLETARIADVLRRLEEGLGAREPFLLLTGEPGTGKTALAHEAVARWDARVAAAFVAFSTMSGAELLEEIVIRFGGQAADGASQPRLLAALERALGELAGRGKVAMIVVDDAHQLAPERLEELRLISNAAQQAGRALEILLVGLPGLEGVLEGAALAPLRQRFSVRARLEPFSAGETRRYLRHRADVAGSDGATLFPRKSCHEVAALTQGVPRRINALALEAMRLARAAEESSVLPSHLAAAAATLWGAVPTRVAPEPDDDEPEEAPRGRIAAPPRPTPVERAPAQAPPPAPPARPAAVEPAAPKAAASQPARPAASPTKPAPVEPAPARAVAPSRPAPGEKPASAPRPSPTLIRPAELSPEPAAAPAASQDPREWVQRFIGDKGPIRIGSQAMAGSVSMRDLREPFEEGEQGPPVPAMTRVRPASRPPARSRPRRGGVSRTAALALVAASLAVAAIVLFVRARLAAPHPPARAAAVLSEPREAPRTARTTSPAPAVTTNREAPPERAPAPAASPNGRFHSPSGRYSLLVGETRDLQAAFDERDRLQHLTGFQGWVVPALEGTDEPDRIVVGIYRSWDRANAAARMLTTSRTVPSATVVATPRRGVRR